MNYYKIILEKHIHLGQLEGNTIEEIIAILLQESINRGSLPGNELHITPISEEEFEQLNDIVEQDNKSFIEGT